MRNETDTSKMILSGVYPQKQLVVLNTTFTTTLDKVHYFPKQISLYCLVRNLEMLNQLLEIPVGNEIIATITSDLSTGVNYLESFS